MLRALPRSCPQAALARQWVGSVQGDLATPDKKCMRVMHFNALADCLAKSAPLLGARRGFRCDPEALLWESRKEMIKHELLRYNCDILGVCEVDHFEDFFEPALAAEGFSSTYRRKRSPAKDGVALFWRDSLFQEGMRRHVFLDRHRGPGSQVALLQRLQINGKNVVVCTTHLRAASGDDIKVQQASEVVTALQDFARGDPQIVLADVNMAAPSGGGSCTAAPTGVFEYFQMCGYRCAYREAAAAGGVDDVKKFPTYTTWAGWSSGDFRSVVDHIFISGGIKACSVLDVPPERPLAETFGERLPNDYFPSDHMSLVADLTF